MFQSNETHYTSQKHNYQIELERLIQAGIIDTKPGAVSIVTVEHDRWCGVYAGRPCNCNPDIIINGQIVNRGIYERIHRN